MKTTNRLLSRAHLCGALLLTVGLVASPLAHAEKGIGKGDTELGFFGNYTNMEDGNANLFTAGVSIGSFISDSFQLRVAPTLSYLDAGALSAFNFTPFISGEFLFRGRTLSNPVVPFIGGGIGINIGFTDTGAPNGDYYNIGLSVGPTGGVKVFLGERTSLELAMTYHVGIGTQCGDVDCFDTSTKSFDQHLRFNFYY